MLASSNNFIVAVKGEFKMPHFYMDLLDVLIVVTVSFLLGILAAILLSKKETPTEKEIRERGDAE